MFGLSTREHLSANEFDKWSFPRGLKRVFSLPFFFSFFLITRRLFAGDYA